MFSLTPGQVRQLLGAVDLYSPFGRRDYLLILFLYQTGLRVGECSGLVTHMVYSQGSARSWLHLPASLCKDYPSHCTSFLSFLASLLVIANI